jgi:hypothetical protein
MAALFTLSFLTALLVWPWVIDTGHYAYFLTGTSWLAVGLAWFYTSSDLISYWDGLHIAAKAAMRGCAGLGIFFVIPVLVSLFMISQFFMLEGLLRGRDASQRHWAKVISWFGFGITQSKRARY